MSWLPFNQAHSKPVQERGGTRTASWSHTETLDSDSTPIFMRSVQGFISSLLLTGKYSRSTNTRLPVCMLSHIRSAGRFHLLRLAGWIPSWCFLQRVSVHLRLSESLNRKTSGALEDRAAFWNFSISFVHVTVLWASPLQQDATCSPTRQSSTGPTD